MKTKRRITMGVLAAVIVATPMIAVSCGDKNKELENKRREAEAKELERKELARRKQKVDEKRRKAQEEIDNIQTQNYEAIKKMLKEDPYYNINPFHRASDLAKKIKDLESLAHVFALRVGQRELPFPYKSDFEVTAVGDENGWITVTVIMHTKDATNPDSAPLEVYNHVKNDVEMEKLEKKWAAEKAEEERIKREKEEHKKMMNAKGFEEIEDKVWYNKEKQIVDYQWNDFERNSLWGESSHMDTLLKNKEKYPVKHLIANKVRWFDNGDGINSRNGIWHNFIRIYKNTLESVEMKSLEDVWMPLFKSNEKEKDLPKLDTLIVPKLKVLWEHGFSGVNLKYLDISESKEIESFFPHGATLGEDIEKGWTKTWGRGELPMINDASSIIVISENYNWENSKRKTWKYNTLKDQTEEIKISFKQRSKKDGKLQDLEWYLSSWTKTKADGTWRLRIKK
ncbi:hypothetical protein [Mycoplasma todarodis]|uniref:Lipoprotein n=1 Tax=Mycoplasma todarodis TaxID=1937191 RepID=A0A4R0XUD4_9MOLU|nr:hypothetical protein [Mycoplasma todarodis]TCG11397.1 hypothetical protein C4B25_01730 [Mycoplasma todarodis]